jgi:integrase
VNIERHLYKVSVRMKNGQWSVFYRARFWCWEERMFEKRLSEHLDTARGLLRRYEILNDQRKPLILEEELQAMEKKKLEEAKANAMTIAKFAKLYEDLPEVKGKDSADRDGELSAHVVRLLGGIALAEISRSDLFAYIDKRRGETLFRCGKWTKTPVKDGTIKNELSYLRHMRNLARRYKDDFAKRGINYDVSPVSFEGVMPEPNHRRRVLKDIERVLLLKESPLWLRRLLTVAIETCLSRGDLLRLRWGDIDEENGVIVPDGGRLKTAVRQEAPLTKPVRTILAALKTEAQARIKEAHKRAGVKAINPAIEVPDDALVFVREDDGGAITGNMISKALPKACKRARVSDFRFHDTRHMAKTNWARNGIQMEVAMLGAGHSSVQMHQAYVHLQASDVGQAFGTALKIERKKRRKSEL